VLATKNLMNTFAVEFITLSMHALVDVKVLALDAVFDASLLSVEKAARDSDVGVCFQSFERFFEEVGIDVARLFLAVLVVVVKDLLDWILGWENDEVVLAGDLLPVVDQNCLENVWDEKSDGWLGAILLFL
jgi:hypothetical protein